MKRASSIHFMAGLIIAVSALVAACKQEVAASGQPATTNAPARQTAAGSKVAKIVFIGKKNACDCTRKRVDDSFAVLTAALADHGEITMEQYQVDVDQPAIAQFQQMRAIMVLPAVYLLDASGKLIEVLQGEVTTEQLVALL